MVQTKNLKLLIVLERTWKLEIDTVCHKYVMLTVIKEIVNRTS